MDGSAISELLAFAELVSPHLGDRRAHDLADALDTYGADLLRHDLTELGGGTHLDACRRALTPALTRAWRQRLAALDSAGVQVLPSCSPEYPVNLRMVFDRPPLLFVRGALSPLDRRAVAVVGTRSPSDEGARLAAELGTLFAQHQITVVSGLATGIDTSAHAGALNAGGRTIAVLGHGLDHRLTGERSVLGRAIAESGAMVSQFWPRQAGARWTFPLRNRVTSGLSLATVVVEAGPTSGAKLQAHDALRHGKRLFLVEQLVVQQPWAAELAAHHPSVTVLTDVRQILDAIEFDLEVAGDVLV